MSDKFCEHGTGFRGECDFDCCESRCCGVERDKLTADLASAQDALRQISTTIGGDSGEAHCQNPIEVAAILRIICKVLGEDS